MIDLNEPSGERDKQVGALESSRLAPGQEYAGQPKGSNTDPVRPGRGPWAWLVASVFAAVACLSPLLPWLVGAVDPTDSRNLGLVALVIISALWATAWLESFRAPKAPGPRKT